MKFQNNKEKMFLKCLVGKDRPLAKIEDSIVALDFPSTDWVSEKNCSENFRVLRSQGDSGNLERETPEATADSKSSFYIWE